MKRWFSFAALFLFLFVWVAGCGGDDVRDDGDDDTEQDSGTIDAGPGFDGGSHDGSTEDGSVTDGSTPDGSITDAGTDGSVVDAGTDSGTDSGIVDAGVDAAVDAGVDAGVDSGVDDAGVDSGVDSGVDAGVDSGVDAGTFDVMGASASNATTVVVTFDGIPETTSAQNANNYAIAAGASTLAVSSAVLSGNTVTLTTTTQAATTYTLTVSGVVRAGDSQPLTVSTATFAGVTTFNLVSATTTSATTVDLKFDAAPDPTEAQNTGNYTLQDPSMTSVTILTASVSGSTVTLTTMSNLGPVGYAITVTGVTRNGDHEALANNHLNFAGNGTFDVSNAVATSNTALTVTFTDPPDPTTATTPSNYVIMDPSSVLLNVSAATLSGNVVTLTTDSQSAVVYNLKVANVTRAGDSAMLYEETATFTGIAATTSSAPTVTNVTVSSTMPNNGTTPFNTGTTTVLLDGTGFTGVDCTTTIGVALDDLDGVGANVLTKATSCSVVNDTQISATFPAGIRTNGSNGWNVKVTNATGTNTTSSVAFVPVAGLLVSEVLIGTTTNANNEFVEIYNPTAASIDTAALGLALHQRSGSGGDTGKTLALVTGRTRTIASHGYLLLASAVSTAETWFSKVDLTYSAAFGGNGGAYISMSATKDVKVLDKLGWGTQPAGGFEGANLANLTNDKSGQRNAGTSTLVDTDNNLADFTISSTITPKGSADGTGP